MRKFLSAVLVSILILVLTACTAVPAITTKPSTAGQTTTSGASTGSTTQAAAVSVPASASVADALAENQKSHADAADYTYGVASAVEIKLAGGAIEVQGSGVTVAGSTATITAPGTYIISGTLADGQLVVNTTSKELVQLVLNGVNITSANSAPIYISAAKKVVILLADQTENTLTDGATYDYAIPAEEEPNAAIFSKADLSIAGSGALTVNANFNDGISSKDGLVIAAGSITVNAADDGIRGKDYLIVENASLVVNAKGDALKSDNDEDAARGYIDIQAGTFQLTAGGDAINAHTDALISGGTFTITTAGGSTARISADASAKAIKGLVGVNIDGGSFTIDAADDGVHSNGAITINNGAFTIASGDDGMHADQSLTLNGGEIQISRSYEGLESAVITINNGTIHVHSSDDGVNISGGNDGSGMGPGRDSFASSNGRTLYINGGYLYVDANGDGLDANGSIQMTDGVVVVNGPTEQMNGALDYDAGFKMTGGSVVAAGSSGMAMAPDANSSTLSVLVFLTSSQPAGTLVTIQNQAGETVLAFTPTKQFQSLAFASSKLVKGETYTVTTGGSATGTAVDGVYQGGTVTPGSQAGTFTISGTVTTLGSGGHMGGPGGGGPGRRP